MSGYLGCKGYLKYLGFIPVLVLALAVFMTGCKGQGDEPGKGQQPSLAAGTPDSIRQIAEARGLSQKDVEAALKTYIPSGKFDESTFSSPRAVTRGRSS